jgi:hypothetical protein
MHLKYAALALAMSDIPTVLEPMAFTHLFLMSAHLPRIGVLRSFSPKN